MAAYQWETGTGIAAHSAYGNGILRESVDLAPLRVARIGTLSACYRDSVFVRLWVIGKRVAEGAELHSHVGACERMRSGGKKADFLVEKGIRKPQHSDSECGMREQA